MTQALLLYLNQGSKAATNELKLAITVHRQHAFWDALQQAVAQHIVPSACSSSSSHESCVSHALIYKLFPRFIDASMVHADGCSSDSSSPSTLTEAGEGHGPRKEFFLLAGQGMVKQVGSWAVEVGWAAVLQTNQKPHTPCACMPSA